MCAGEETVLCTVSSQITSAVRTGRSIRRRRQEPAAPGAPARRYRAITTSSAVSSRASAQRRL